VRVVFFGAGAFGLPPLQLLAARHLGAGVVPQPDRPAGRGGKATPTPIGEWGAAHLPRVPLFKPPQVADAGVVADLRRIAAESNETEPTCFIVIAFGQKMPRTLLDGIFAINLHASLLPRWRGAAPINAAILAGDKVTGNSVITLADRMDAGLVLGQTARQIDPDTTAGELHDLLAADGPELVDRVLTEWQAGTLQLVEQDESMVTKAGKLRKEDGWVDFSHGAEACRRRVHGLTPWPGVTVRFRGEDLKLTRVRTEPQPDDAAPGTLVDARGGLVACAGADRLRLLEVQPPGKKTMNWCDFANGRRVTTGERLEGRGAA
jgi:methionyl-tRNA formyltransferase